MFNGFVRERTPQLAGLDLKVSDVLTHVIQIGVDVFPPIDPNAHMTRLNLFAEAAKEKWPDLFGTATVKSGAQFSISGEFKGSGNHALHHEVVQLTPRGPVISLPLQLHPLGVVGDEEASLEIARAIRKLFFDSMPTLQCMRLGLVRDLTFDAGPEPAFSVIGEERTFAGAGVIGGQRMMAFRDQVCNIRIMVQPGQYELSTHLAGLGKTVADPPGNAVQAILDVNNHDIRPMTELDIAEVIDRATSLWPKDLLRFLNGR